MMNTPGTQFKDPSKANNCSFAHELSNADQLFKSGKLVEAKRAYLKVLQAVPDQPDLLHLIGLIEYEQGNFSPAQAFLRRAIAADANRPEFYLNLGRFYNADNKPDEALKLFQKALILKPDCPQTCCQIGEVFKKQGAYKRAVTWYQKAIRLAPKYTSAYNNLGNCYQALKQFDAAVRCYQQALVVNRKDALATHNLGNAKKNGFLRNHRGRQKRLYSNRRSIGNGSQFLLPLRRIYP